jgi:AcrR family transcriptional regulator
MRRMRSTGRHDAAVADAEIEPWSFNLAELLAADAANQAFPKGQRTLLKLKAGAAATLNMMPYQTMRVADIVKAAGVSHGLFYHYFTDKQAVTLEILAELMRTSDSRYAKIHASKDSFESLYVANTYYLNVYRKNAGLMRAALSLSDEVDTFRQAWNDTVDRWHKRIARSMRAQSGQGNILNADADLLAYCLGAMIDQILRQLFVQQNPHLRQLALDQRHLAEVLSVAWFRATYARDPTPKQIEACRALTMTAQSAA